MSRQQLKVDRSSSQKAIVIFATALAVLACFIPLEAGQCQSAPSLPSLPSAQKCPSAEPARPRSGSRHSTGSRRYENGEQGPRKFSNEMKRQKYDEQGVVCNICLKKFPFSQMEGDHIVPYSKGGQTVYFNLQMLCRPCNRRKGDK